MKNESNPCEFKFLENKVDSGISLLRELFSEIFFVKSERLFGQIGNFFSVIAAFTFLIIGISFAIKNDSFNAFLFGIVLFSTVILAQYISIKLVNPIITSVENLPTSISNSSILDIVALLSFLIGICFLIASIYFSVKFNELKLLIIGFGIFLSNSYAVCVFLNPKLINVSVSEGLSPARDLLSLMSAFAKMSARTVAITYGSLVSVGALGLLYESRIIFDYSYIQYEQIEIIIPISILGVGIFYPIISFFGLAFIMLNIQLMEALLGIVPHLKSIAILLRKTNKTES